MPFEVHKNKSPNATFPTRNSSIAPGVGKPLATTQRLKPKLQIIMHNHMAMGFDVTQPRASDQKNSRPFIRCSSLHTGHEKKVSPKMPERHSQIAAIRRDLARTVAGTTLVGRQDLRCEVSSPARPVPTQPLTALRYLWAVPQLDVVEIQS